MKIGFYGLGRMGGNMVARLLAGGHEIVASNRSQGSIKEIEKKGAIGAYSFHDLVGKLKPPRAIWLMVPAGEAVQKLINDLIPLLSEGDILIDGGNSYYKDSMKRAEELSEHGIHFLDAGTSGGIWGRENGYCIMVGGAEPVFKQLEPIFKTLAPENGYSRVGPSGAGHFVKMIHNGIEYGMLQAYGEGFEIMNASGFELDFSRIARLWNHGSVVRSWLLELVEKMYEKDPNLASVQGYVEDSGEGRWTAREAVEKNISAPVITLSLLERLRSRQESSYSAKVIAALRNEFGGHAVKKS